MKRFKGFLGFSPKSFVSLGVASALSAVFDATALVTIVPLALAISSDDNEFRGKLLGRTLHLSVGALLTITVALIVGRCLMQSLTSWIGARIASRYEALQRKTLFDAFLDADWALQSKQLGGHLHELMTTSVSRTALAMGSFCSGIVSVFSLIILTGFAFVVNPAVSLAILGGMLGLFFAIRPLSRLTVRVSRAQQSINLNYAHDISQAAGMTKEIKIFNAGRAVKAANQRLVDGNRHTRFRQLLLFDAVPATYQSLALMAVVFGLAVVWWLHVGKLSSLAAIVLLMIRALSQSQTLQGTYHRMMDAGPFLDSIAENLEEMRASREVTAGAEIDSIASIGFQDVSFSYLPGEKVLRNVTFEAHRGEAIGIVGPSGAGKSTFVQLLLRLRDPDTGDILLNGEPASGYSRSSFFDRVGFVPQEPVLLHASVADNIRFHRPDVSHEAIVRAARLAHVDDEIMSWPMGYETMVGERGGAVSGGQRQRICIARALLLRPDIVILDEPTSALDAHSEALIQTTMQGLRGEVTLFIVAHRLSTLNICDRIMVFRDGVLQAFAERQALARDNQYYSDALRLSRLA